MPLELPPLEPPEVSPLDPPELPPDDPPEEPDSDVTGELPQPERMGIVPDRITKNRRRRILERTIIIKISLRLLLEIDDLGRA